MTVTISPRRALCGTLSAPPSKSDAHRAIIAASLADAPTRIRLPEFCEDTRATVDCLAALGARFQYEGGVLTVTPIGTGVGSPSLDCGESGSTLRFLLPIAAALGRHVTFLGKGRLPERPILPLLSELSAHGVTFDAEKLPLGLSGKLCGGDFTLPGNLSSQFISGLLFALPLTGDACRIRVTGRLESAAYIEMTLAVLKEFGVHWQKEGDSFLLPAGQTYRSPTEYTVTGDISSAAFFLTAGALGGDAELSICGNYGLQADRVILDALTLAGAAVTAADGKIRVIGKKLSPFSFDVSSCPDIFPILAILAAAAEGESRLYGAARLRLKESDRIASTAAMLRALGGEVKEEADALTVYGKGRLLGGAVAGANDHRIVMAAAVAAILCEEPVSVTDAEAVAKSYPAFFADYQALGGAVDGI